VVALGVLSGTRHLRPRLRLGLSFASLLFLCLFLAAYSWSRITAHPGSFLLSYIELANMYQIPTNYDGFFEQTIHHFGRVAASLIGVFLIILGTTGPWFFAFTIFAVIVFWKKRTCTSDLIPIFLLAVASIAFFLAPMPRNGDLSEFRQRAGPLLAVVMAVWTMHFATMVGRRGSIKDIDQRQDVFIPMIALSSLFVLASSISSAKIPRMSWAQSYYGVSLPHEMNLIAPMLKIGQFEKPRFAVAGQPAETRSIDQASNLVALSGVPSYLSCPALWKVMGGGLAREAEYRLEVIHQLEQATNLSELRQMMAAAGITHLVVTDSNSLSFDPDRRHAAAHPGTYAVYLAIP
jgi:hypothetical protein